MKQLIAYWGLPGSGKSTAAYDEIVKSRAEHTISRVVRVNKDEIRRELETKGWTWSKENERDVVMMRDAQIQTALNDFAVDTVISDDTNLAQKHLNRLEEIAHQCGAEYEERAFRSSALKCINRDANRSGKAQVGAQVIMRMATEYQQLLWPGHGAFEQVTPNDQIMPAVICDIDGTLALNVTGRSFYDETRVFEDEVNRPIAKIIRALNGQFVQIIYLSGRKETGRDLTRGWLESKACPPGPLHMRNQFDNRKDWITKAELFDYHVRGKYDVLCVLDDRQQVVDMWRSIGLTCLQVAQGDF